VKIYFILTKVITFFKQILPKKSLLNPKIHRIYRFGANPGKPAMKMGNKDLLKIKCKILQVFVKVTDN